MTNRMKKRGQAFGTDAAWIKWHENKPDPHPQYLLPEDLPQTIFAWPTDDPSVDVPPYFSYTNTKPVTPQGQLGPDPVNDVDTLMWTWVNENVIGADQDYYELQSKFAWDVFFEGGGVDPTAEIYCTVYALEPDNVTRRLLGTSNAQVVVEGEQTVVNTMDYFEITVVVGERIMVELWGDRASQPGATLTLFTEGNDITRFATLFPIAAYPAPHAPSHAPGASDPLDPYYPSYVNTAQPGYGQITNPTQGVPGADIDANWQPMLLATQETFAPRNVSFTGGQMFHEVAGVWRWNFNLQFTSDLAPQLRFTNFRLTNVTKGTSSPPVSIPVFRNQDIVQHLSGSMFEIADTEVNDTYQAEIGGGDTLTGIVWIEQLFNLDLTSEYRL
jgi:hypothetical protein